MMQKIQAGSLIALRIEAKNGRVEPPVLFNPSGGAFVTITNPSGTDVVSLGSMTNAATGIYTYDYQSATNGVLGAYALSFKFVDTSGTTYEPATLGFMLVDENGTATTPGALVGINADFLLGHTWASPGAIGSTPPTSGVFTSLTVSTGASNTLKLAQASNSTPYNTITLNGDVGATRIGLVGGAAGDSNLYLDVPTGGVVRARVNGATIGDFTASGLAAPLHDKGVQVYDASLNYGGAATGVLPTNTGPQNDAAWAALVAYVVAHSPGGSTLPGGVIFIPPGQYAAHLVVQDGNGIRVRGAGFTTKVETYDSNPVIDFFSNIGSGGISNFSIEDLYVFGEVRIWNSLFGALRTLRIDGLLNIQGSGNIDGSNLQAYGGANFGNGGGALTYGGPINMTNVGFGGGSTPTALVVNGSAVTCVDCGFNAYAGGPGACTITIDGTFTNARFVNCHAESTSNSASDGATFLIGSVSHPQSVVIDQGTYYGHGNGGITPIQRDFVRLHGAKSFTCRGVTIGLSGTGFSRAAFRLESTAFAGLEPGAIADNVYDLAGTRYSDASGRVDANESRAVTFGGSVTIGAGGVTPAHSIALPAYGSISAQGSFLASGRPGLVSTSDLLLAASPGGAVSLGVTAYDNLLVDANGNVGVRMLSPTARFHLPAGTATATTAPLKFTSGPVLTTPEAGAVEFLADAWYGTITTGAARKTFAFLESPSLTSPTLTNPTLAGTVSGAPTWGSTQAMNISGNAATATSAAPTGPAGGDLAGTYPNPTMASTTGSNAYVRATSPTLVTPALGTPTALVLTSATGLPISSGVSGLGANVATFLATPSSANLLAAMMDKTGTGLNVFGTAPTLTTSLTVSTGATNAVKIAQNSGATTYNTISLNNDVTNTGQIGLTGGADNNLYLKVPTSGTVQAHINGVAALIIWPNALQPAAFTFANIATALDVNGKFGYCSDCTIANPCAGAGTGAFAKRLNGVNVCN